MNRYDVQNHIKDYIDGFDAVSDHDHHLDDSFFNSPPNLDKILGNSYLAWTGFSWGESPRSREEFLGHVSYNSYFTWLEKGIQKVHNWDQDIRADNWDALSEKMGENYAHGEFHLNSLKTCFKKMIIDTYWNPGGDNGHPEIFVPSFRIDKFMYGFHPESEAPDRFFPWQEYRFSGTTIDEYVENMCSVIKERYDRGKIKAFKCAEAYKRSINFLPDERKRAEIAFRRPPLEITGEDKIFFGNYIFNRCCELAEELSLPFQIHTGLGDLSGSEPMNLLPLLQKYPGINFILLHSGYPWTNQIGGIIHNHPNAFPSLTWTPSISTSAAMAALNDYIDVSPSIRHISWGTDSWTTEEAVGALLAWRHVLTNVITERIVSRDMSIAKGERLAELLLSENNVGIYSLKKGKKGD
ncbi:MAG: amidohydrolase family protein [Spirochaetales bacterium]|nr:amidohydrolase family protein [Spirochaetales bacterium]